MTLFEMVKYHGQEYPKEIPIRIEEIAAHFDITTVEGRLGYSLHTEYSYGKRNLNSALILNYPEIRRSQKDGVTMLLFNGFCLSIPFTIKASPETDISASTTAISCL